MSKRGGTVCAVKECTSSTTGKDISLFRFPKDSQRSVLWLEACERGDLVPRPCLNELDSVLNELGMLATSAKSREDYLAEIHNKKYNMLTINTRYVSNVSIGFRVRPVAPHVRYKPYKTPKERYRTRSENNDSEATGFVKNVVDDCIDSALEEITQLKKAKSLESIMAENGQSVDLKNCNLGKPSELEVVSNCIQNLKVAE